MPWCPKCKYEYVAGIKACPDCKVALVNSLDEIKNDEYSQNGYEYESEGYEYDSESAAEEVAAAKRYKALEFEDKLTELFDNEEDAKAMLEKLKSGEMKPAQLKAMLNAISDKEKESKYESVQDRYHEHKTSANVLCIVGLAGIILSVLNYIGVLNLPIGGPNNILMNIVVCGLFVIFFVAGIASVSTAKKLEPMVAVEKENIEKAGEFLKKCKEAGDFKLSDDIPMEERSLLVSQLAIEKLEAEFPEFESGFAFYVTENLYGDMLEDED